MRDISHKQVSLRIARASGTLFCDERSIELVKQNKLAKGSLFDVARVAAMMGAKLTSQLLPHCHPVGIDSLQVDFEYLSPERDCESHKQNHRTGIIVHVEGKSIGRTGIEMEVLTAVSIACLEMYDMLKPVDNNLEISHIQLIEKTGGKSDKKMTKQQNAVCAVLVCSDSCASGIKTDVSGDLLCRLLNENGSHVQEYLIIPDDKDLIQQTVQHWVSSQIGYIFITGGTGLSNRDNTTAAIQEILEKEAPGISEAIRAHGQMRTPFAMFSQAISGSIAETLIVCLPGSPSGVQESMDAILPAIFHAGAMLKSDGHER